VVAAVPARLGGVGVGAASELAQVVSADVGDAARPEQFRAFFRVLSGQDAVDEADAERNPSAEGFFDVGEGLAVGVAAGDLLVL
jgi:hypothetical protein